MIDLIYQRLPGCDVEAPAYHSKKAAGMDFRAVLKRPCAIVQNQHQVQYFLPNAEGHRYLIDTKSAENYEYQPINELPKLTIRPGESIIVSLGFKVQIASNHYMKLVVRSSVGRRGLRLGNTVGIIDEDYRGGLLCILHNYNLYDPTTIVHGDRIIQGIVSEYKQCQVKEGVVDATERGEGGLGSTGVN